MVFGSIGSSNAKGTKASSSIRHPSPRRAVVGERRPTRSMVKHWSEHCWPTSVASHECGPCSGYQLRRRKTGGALVRERKALTNERVRHVNRVKGFLFGQGISRYEPLKRDRRECLEALVTGDGRPLPPALKAQIGRELDRIELLIRQIREVEQARDAMLLAAEASSQAPALLLNLKGIGPEFAAVLWSEGLSRQFDNRRQVAAYAGLAPTPWQSGQISHDQGVSKSGNPRLRTTLIQVAWLWVRHQPESALTAWFKERVAQNGGRQKKSTIVALARKLLVAMWKYVNAGVVIEGAVLTAT